MGIMGCRCNITLEVNHLTEGIRLGLQDDREKNSDVLGRLALFKVCTLSNLTAWAFTGRTPACTLLLQTNCDGVGSPDVDSWGKTAVPECRRWLVQGSSVITKLPPYMTVQMVRFFFKVDTRQKAKILRKVCTKRHHAPSRLLIFYVSPCLVHQMAALYSHTGLLTTSISAS